MTFQVSALPYAPFAGLFDLDEAALAARHARLVIAEAGFPCRVSLSNAAAGERCVLVNHCHQPADTPYRATHAIFVREGAVRAQPAVGEVPESLCGRLLSLRAFDDAGNLVAADVAEDGAIAPAVGALFATPGAAYVHAHYAKQGCFAARIDRA